MTVRGRRRFLAPAFLLCALTVLLVRPSADAARAVDPARPVADLVVNALVATAETSEPAATEPAAEQPMATLDWSGLVVAVNPDSVEPPAAPPLSLPDVEVEVVATAPVLPTSTAMALPPPTAVSTATALPPPTAVSTAMALPPPTAVSTAMALPSPTAVSTAMALPPATVVPTAIPTPVPSPPSTAIATAVSAVPTAVPWPTSTASPTAVPVVPTAAPVLPTAVPVAPVSSLSERGRRALGTLGYDIRSIGYTISFHPHTGSHRGLTFTTVRHIEIYIKPTTSDSELAYIIGHEVGHAVDHIRNTSADRDRWKQARGIAASTSWWPTGIYTDFATPAGDFAECFASWRLGSASHSSWGGCGAMNSLMAELATS